MSNREGLQHESLTPRLGPRGLVVLGVLSVLLFWVPLVAPLIQLASLTQSFRAARWGVTDGWSLALGLGGAFAGFGLFLALESLWVI